MNFEFVLSLATHARQELCTLLEELPDNSKEYETARSILQDVTKLKEEIILGQQVSKYYK